MNAAPGTSKGNGKGKKGSQTGTKSDPSKSASKDDKVYKQNSRVCTLLLTHARKGTNTHTSMTRITCTMERNRKHLRRALQLVQPQFMHVPLRSCQGTVAAISVSGVKSQGASSLLAPSHGVWEQVSNFCGRGKSCKKHSKRTSKTVLKKPGNNHHPYAFERASKCFAAMASVCCPMNVNQDFLIDWGAGEPQKSSSCYRNSTQAINLQGELSGDGAFYALKIAHLQFP